MLTEKQQKAAAAAFAQRWKGRGYEKGESQSFWLDLLASVYGVEQPTEYVRFEQQVMLEAHRRNDRAVMDAYGFSTRMTEPECTSRLLELYARLAKG